MTQYKFQLQYSPPPEDAIVEPNYYRIKTAGQNYVSRDGDRFMVGVNGMIPRIDFVLDTQAKTLTADFRQIGLDEDNYLVLSNSSQLVAWQVKNQQISLYFSSGYLEYSCWVVSDYLQASGIGTLWFDVIGDKIPDTPD